MPILNEADILYGALRALVHEQHFNEVIIVDGGSTDSSIAIVQRFITNHPDQNLLLLHGAAGRAQQMNIGATVATSSVLLFLHADTRLPPQIGPTVCTTLGNHGWGFFRIRFDDQSLLLRLISQMMCWRSRLSSIATGDQALFVDTSLFRTIGGFAQIPLMEDIEICARLKSSGHPGRILQPVQTSARRWQHQGVFRTILLMWSLRFAYWRGVDPAELLRRYHHAR